MMLHYGLTTQLVLLRDLNHVTQNVLKLTFGYDKYSSVTGMLMELGIPSFNSSIHSYNVSSKNRQKTL